MHWRCRLCPLDSEGTSCGPDVVELPSRLHHQPGRLGLYLDFPLFGHWPLSFGQALSRFRIIPALALPRSSLFSGPVGTRRGPTPHEENGGVQFNI